MRGTNANGPPISSVKPGARKTAYSAVESLTSRRNINFIFVK